MRLAGGALRPLHAPPPGPPQRAPLTAEDARHPRDHRVGCPVPRPVSRLQHRAIERTEGEHHPRTLRTRADQHDGVPDARLRAPLGALDRRPGPAPPRARPVGHRRRTLPARLLRRDPDQRQDQPRRDGARDRRRRGGEVLHAPPRRGGQGSRAGGERRAPRRRPRPIARAQGGGPRDRTHEHARGEPERRGPDRHGDLPDRVARRRRLALPHAAHDGAVAARHDPGRDGRRGPRERGRLAARRGDRVARLPRSSRRRRSTSWTR